MSNDTKPKAPTAQVEHQIIVAGTSDASMLEQARRGMDDLSAAGYRLHSTTLNDRGLFVAVMTRETAK